MKALLFYTALAITLVAALVLASWILNGVYVSYCKIPIEAVEVVVFTGRLALTVAVLSVPFGAGIRWLLRKRGISGSFAQYCIAAISGGILVVLIFGIAFPCDVRPYFVGGYFWERAFHVTPSHSS